MKDLTEVITSAEFHPTHCHTLAYSSSKGSILLIDLRQSALCDKHSKLKKMNEHLASTSHLATQTGPSSYFNLVIANGKSNAIQYTVLLSPAGQLKESAQTMEQVSANLETHQVMYIFNSSLLSKSSSPLFSPSLSHKFSSKYKPQCHRLLPNMGSTPVEYLLESSTRAHFAVLHINEMRAINSQVGQTTPSVTGNVQ